MENCCSEAFLNTLTTNFVLMESDYRLSEESSFQMLYSFLTSHRLSGKHSQLCGFLFLIFSHNNFHKVQISLVIDPHMLAVVLSPMGVKLPLSFCIVEILLDFLSFSKKWI